MPIIPHQPVRRISQAEFQEIAYEVLGHAFAIHNDFGRFFDEQIYKRELAGRSPEVELEFPIQISHETFSTTYFLDALVAGSAAFEFKTAQVLASQHHGQLYNYLLLLDLAHGKLVNFRPESLQHEFVNATIRSEERRRFAVATQQWNSSLPGATAIQERTINLLRDWGTGLELGIYEMALTHFFGGEQRAVRKVSVQGDRNTIGQQTMRFVADGVAFKVTAFKSTTNSFEDHVRRLLRHVDLRAILWINIAIDCVTFTAIEKRGL